MLNEFFTSSAGSSEPLKVEDVFSTFVYNGILNSSKTITNGLNLDGEGGMVLVKQRHDTRPWMLMDTERGTDKFLYTHDSPAEGTLSGVISYNSDGFTLAGGAGYEDVNGNNRYYGSWSFRKAPGFFDVVTYTGDDVSGRTIAHSLDSVPGMIWVKRTDNSGSWTVYHRNQGATKYAALNSNNRFNTSSSRWNDTAPTASVFSVGNDASVNASGGSYIAYLFAHDDARFEASGSESIIKCDAYTGNGSSTGPIVDLGFRPQFVMIKRASNDASWFIWDTERGCSMIDAYAVRISPDVVTREDAGTTINFTDTGFQVVSNETAYNGSGNTYVYMAISDVQNIPTTGTDLLEIQSRDGTSSNVTIDLGYRGRMLWVKRRDGKSDWYTNSRGTGTSSWRFNDNNNANAGPVSDFHNAHETNEIFYASDPDVNTSSDTYINYFFRAAKGAFTEFSYLGTGGNTTISHSLGAVPQLWIVKSQSGNQYPAYAGSASLASNQHLITNLRNGATGSSFWNSTYPTSTTLSLGDDDEINANAAQYNVMLFGNVAGVIDIGKYQGTDTAGLQIDCGFSGGARFVLIKSIDSDGDWYVFDTVRGIVSSGNEPYLLLNDDGDEITGSNYIDPYSSGFEISTDFEELNKFGEEYLYMAIA